MQTVIWMFTIGVAIGTLTVYYNSRFVGRFVRALLDIDAVSPDTAIAESELGLKITPLLRFALRPKGALSEVVHTAEDGRYYIAPERIVMARRKYRDEHVTIFYVLLIFLIVGVFSLGASYIFPELLDYVKGNFSEIFG